MNFGLSRKNSKAEVRSTLADLVLLLDAMFKSHHLHGFLMMQSADFEAT